MRNITILLSITFALCLCAIGAMAADNNENCLGCHADKAKGKSVHAAVKRGCKVCHLGMDATSIPHKFFGTKMGLPSTSSVLCFSCHEKKKVAGRKFVHTPVKSGMCLSCHNPHASPFPKLLVAENLCDMCHDKSSDKTKKSIHAPVAGGMCMNCHTAHQSNTEKLIQDNPQGICYQCHDRDKFSANVVHVPVAFGMCAACHDPHYSNNDHLIRTIGQDMCLGCHEREDIVKKEVHLSIGDMSCLDCHTPHISKEKYLLR